MFLHEVESVESKLLDFYLGWDLFHDVRIEEVRGDLSEGILEIRFGEMNLAERCLPEHLGVLPSIVSGCTLTFQECKEFRIECDSVCPPSVGEFLQGRFKASSALARLTKEYPERKLFHYRITVSADGYIDVIFSNVEVQGLQIPTSFRSNRVPLNSVFKYRNVAQISMLEAEMLLDGLSAWKVGPVLIRAWLRKDEEFVSLARKCLDSTDIEVWAAAVFMLGHLGETNDIRTLLGEMIKYPYPIHRRQVLDAVDWLCARSDK
jgi:hypothetical protein